LIAQVREKVRSRFGVELETEVIVDRGMIAGRDVREE
jgi:UDP-N-acetylenolpyruvoylglucosamine reductase